MRRVGTHWTLAETEELKARHAAGESAQQIAVAIGLMGDMGYVTRNMVIGRLWRLGLSKERPARPRPHKPAEDHPFRRRAAQARRKREVKEQVTGKLGQWTSDPKRMTKPQMPVDGICEVPGMRCVALEDLERGDCRWPLWKNDRRPWDREAIFYCGAEALDGCSYCEHHAAVAYTPCGRVNSWLVPGN